MGRHTKLTPGIQSAIAQAVADGVPLITAAQLAGVAERTVLEWMARGQGTHPKLPPSRVYTQFAQDITHARGEDENRRIARLNQAAQGGQVLYQKTVERVDSEGHVTSRVVEVRYAPPDWRADAFVLERSRPDDWGRKERVDLRLTIERAAKQVADELGLTVAEVLEEAEQLLKKVDAQRRSQDT